MPTKPTRTTWPQAAVLLAGFVALASGTGWLVFTSAEHPAQRQRRPPVPQAKPIRLITFDRPFPPEGRFVADPYVGSRECADCHPGESALFSRSGHAVTLRPAGRVDASRKLDGATQADPQIPGVTWNYRYADDQLHITRKSPSDVQQWVADYAIGSGHHALTYVSVIDHKIPQVLEHRLTVYHRKDGKDELGITPGHDSRVALPGLGPFGGQLPPRIARSASAAMPLSSLPVTTTSVSTRIR